MVRMIQDLLFAGSSQVWRPSQPNLQLAEGLSVFLYVKLLMLLSSVPVSGEHRFQRQTVRPWRLEQKPPETRMALVPDQPLDPSPVHPSFPDSKSLEFQVNCLVVDLKQPGCSSLVTSRMIEYLDQNLPFNLIYTLLDDLL